MADVEKKVAEVFTTAGVELIEIPFSSGSAMRSFLKTIDKVPPSDKTQEFKDGVLWSDCCQLLNQEDVFLVTADKAFFEERDYQKGLVSNLREEASSFSHDLWIFPSLQELLKELRTEVEIDEMH